MKVILQAHHSGGSGGIIGGSSGIIGGSHSARHSNPSSTRTKLPLEYHNPLMNLNPDLRPFRMSCHGKSGRVFDERVLRAEDGPTMYRTLEPQTMSFGDAIIGQEETQDTVCIFTAGRQAAQSCLSIYLCLLSLSIFPRPVALFLDHFLLNCHSSLPLPRFF